MPSVSEKQRRFFFLVKGVQKGKISPKQVGSKISKVAKSMSKKDVDDFTCGKDLPKKKIEEIIKILKEVQYNIKGNTFSGNPCPMEPMYLNEESNDDQNTIAKTFVQQGNIEQYSSRFSGLEIKPKEKDAISNFTEGKPTKQDAFSIRYETTDEFGNSKITIIKKLREGSKLVFISFQTSKPTQQASTKNAPNQESITVKKSISFADEIEGGNILSNMLRKLEI